MTERTPLTPEVLNVYIGRSDSFCLVPFILVSSSEETSLDGT